MRLLLTIKGVEVFQDDSRRVHFIAGAMIDADGANGQHGSRPAYNSTNTGSDHLANGGMKIEDGDVIFSEPWGRDIVLTNGNGSPLVLGDGTIPSKTAYRFKCINPDDPAAYVDSETVPYAVVSPLIRNAAKGVVMGCKCIMTNLKTDKSVVGVVADIGPRSKIGELSIAAARGLGIPSSPRTGGEERKIIKYELFPGEPAEVNGQKFDLIPA